MPFVGPGSHAPAGKDLWLVTSTGSAESAYSPLGTQRHFFDAFLPPYEQTAELTGMRFLPPLVLHGAHRTSDEELEADVAMFTQRLARYPDWPEMADIPACLVREIDADERPELED